MLHPHPVVNDIRLFSSATIRQLLRRHTPNLCSSWCSDQLISYLWFDTNIIIHRLIIWLCHFCDADRFIISETFLFLFFVHCHHSFIILVQNQNADLIFKLVIFYALLSIKNDIWQRLWQIIWNSWTWWAMVEKSLLRRRPAGARGERREYISTRPGA